MFGKVPTLNSTLINLKKYLVIILFELQFAFFVKINQTFRNVDIVHGFVGGTNIVEKHLLNCKTKFSIFRYFMYNLFQKKKRLHTVDIKSVHTVCIS